MSIPTITNRRGIIAVVAATIVTLCLMLSLRRPYFDVSHLDFGLNSNSHDENWWAEKPGTSETTQEAADDKNGPAPGNNTPEGALEDGNTPELPHEKNQEKLAFLTFLSGTLHEDDEDLDNDNYFIATRILVWHLLHCRETRIERKNIDVIVMVTPSVTESRRNRLLKDGAILYSVDFVRAESDWFMNSKHEHRWDDVLTKFRAWEMTDYSRILLLDGDIILRDKLDGVFDDPGAQIQQTLHQDNRTNLLSNLTTSRPQLPDNYLLAGLGETAHAIHPFPPTWEDGLQKPGYFNSGFFLLRPDPALFTLYTTILNTPNSFDPKYPEQNLLNKVHKWEGSMPWKEIDYAWNIVHVNDADLEGGVKSVHAKWWHNPMSKSKAARDLFRRVRWEMQGWYDAYDLQVEYEEGKK